MMADIKRKKDFIRDGSNQNISSIANNDSSSYIVNDNSGSFTNDSGVRNVSP